MFLYFSFIMFIVLHNFFYVHLVKYIQFTHTHTQWKIHSYTFVCQQFLISFLKFAPVGSTTNLWQSRYDNDNSLKYRVYFNWNNLYKWCEFNLRFGARMVEFFLDWNLMPVFWSLYRIHIEKITHSQTRTLSWVCNIACVPISHIWSFK